MIRWIASYPKSGNTWVRLFLKAYIDPAGFGINTPLRGHVQDNVPHFLAKVSPVPVGELTEAEHYNLRPAALVHMVREYGVPYVKTHSANITLDWRPNLIPPDLTEKAIYIFRDPRDVAVSFADYLGVSIDETIDLMAKEASELASPGARQNRGPQPLGTWSLHVRSWTRQLPYPVFAIQYERLLEDPEGGFRALLEFLGMEADEFRLSWAMRLTGFASLRSREEREGYHGRSPHHDRFFRSGKAGGWRDVLTPEQAARIESDHEEVMAKWGYLRKDREEHSNQISRADTIGSVRA